MNEKWIKCKQIMNKRKSREFIDFLAIGSGKKYNVCK